MRQLNLLRKATLFKYPLTSVSPEVSAVISTKTILSTATVDTIAAMIRDPVLGIADYGSALRRAAMGTNLRERSLKTWQNYVSAARAVHCCAVVEYPDQLPSIHELAEWLTGQLAAGGFLNSVDDVANWALGRDSIRERHEKKARMQASDASAFPQSNPFWKPDQRIRPIPTSADQAPDRVEADARLYLRKHYTNTSGKMFCQVCKSELPFVLPNGAYYFEAVEISTSPANRCPETFLALCPNHAAMFRFANEQKDVIQELVEAESGLEIDVVLAGKATTVQFTEIHLADMQARLKAEDIQSTSARIRQTVSMTKDGKIIVVVRKPSSQM